MKTLFSLILFLTVISFSSSAVARPDQRENIPDFSEMFISDVISILPPKMQQVVAKKKNQLKSECRLGKLSSSKKLYSISKNSFIERYSKAPNENGLPVWLVNSMEDIFLVAFSSTAPDPFHDRFRDNLKRFMFKYLSQTAVIDYKGYQGETTRAITDRIYDSRRITEEGQKYSALVQLTADLWAAGWKNNGGEVTTVAKSFERVNSIYSRRVAMTQATGKPGAGKQKQGKATRVKQVSNRFDGTIELYVTEWCSRCKEAEDYIKMMGYPYVKYDVEKSSDAMKRKDSYPGRGVPLVVVGKKNFRGFSPDALEYYMEN